MDQHRLPLQTRHDAELEQAAQHFSSATVDERGAIFTKREVVDFILDLVGYTEDQDLSAAKLLEPSAGHADFLLPAISRLVRSYLAHGGRKQDAKKRLASAIVAVEVHPDSAATARQAIAGELAEQGLSQPTARELANLWVREGDFLLTPLNAGFTHVVGNPPYVRQELIPEPLLALYRARFRTLYDRADLYVPFFERSLDLLAPGGKLGFICTDRWMKNKYGRPLRQMVADDFALTHYIDLVDTQAFLADVMTYPAITVIERLSAPTQAQPTRVAHRPALDEAHLKELARVLTGTGGQATEVANVVVGGEPWILDAPDRLRLVRRLEAAFPLLEDAGCKVGIGVATGNDGVYIGPMKELDVEPSRKLPLVRTQDIRHGEVQWQGMGVLNPFEDNGRIVDLARYPRFARHLEKHAGAVRARNVAKRNPDRWFRTIDRIYPDLVTVPKLLIPDIKGDAHIVFEEGKLYPHHNLYFITSAQWDIRALQAVLLSGIARLFVATYSTKMRGGFLRFQAQYLRRIRLPMWDDVPKALRAKLKNAAIANDRTRANEATFELFNLTAHERELVLNA